MTENLSNIDRPLKTLTQLRDEARLRKRGFEINGDNLRFHSLPEFVAEIVQNGGRVLVDIGGNVFILNSHDKDEDK